MQYDIAIVGAGLVGASLAIALQDLGLRIALIDATQPNPNDQRLFALNSSSVQCLNNMAVWPEIAEQASPIERVHVSRRKHFGVVQLRPEDVGQTVLGYMMPARYIEGALAERLASLSSLDVYRPMTLLQLREQEESVSLQLQQGEVVRTIEARYVMGADGTQSTVRHLMGFDAHVEEYQETAIVAEVQVAHDHHQTAYERFYEEGVLAMLPLKQQTMALILTTPTREATRLVAMEDAEFLAHIQLLFGNRVGCLQQVSQRASYPLRLVLANKAASHRVLLLGNAAHTVHPVAAQGFNLALYEVAVLVDAIASALKKEPNMLNINCVDVQSQFTKQQALSIQASRRLATMLHHPSIMTNIAMSFGMAAFEALPFLKRQFLRGMLGRSNRVPRLMSR